MIDGRQAGSEATVPIRFEHLNLVLVEGILRLFDARELLHAMQKFVDSRGGTVGERRLFLFERLFQFRDDRVVFVRFGVQSVDDLEATRKSLSMSAIDRMR